MLITYWKALELRKIAPKSVMDFINEFNGNISIKNGVFKSSATLKFEDHDIFYNNRDELTKYILMCLYECIRIKKGVFYFGTLNFFEYIYSNLLGRIWLFKSTAKKGSNKETYKTIYNEVREFISLTTKNIENLPNLSHNDTTILFFFVIDNENGKDRLQIVASSLTEIDEHHHYHSVNLEKTVLLTKCQK